MSGDQIPICRDSWVIIRNLSWKERIFEQEFVRRVSVGLGEISAGCMCKEGRHFWGVEHWKLNTKSIGEGI
jgi:hypothetical protein